MQRYTVSKYCIIRKASLGGLYVLIRYDAGWFVTKTGNLVIGTLVSYGPAIIPLLLAKQRYPLSKEGDEGTEERVVNRLTICYDPPARAKVFSLFRLPITVKPFLLKTNVAEVIRNHITIVIIT